MRLVPLFLVLAPGLALEAQTTRHVPADHGTIQAAIDASSDGDVVLVAPGIYPEQIDFLGKAIEVTSSGGAAVTTIDSQGAKGWFDFPYAAVVRMIDDEGPDSILAGFTVTGGVGDGTGAAGSSGIYCADLSPTVRDCVIRDNSGGVGGGILGNPLLERCEIRDNDSLPYGEGGGVWGRPTIVDCSILNNRSGGLGGGVYATGSITITGSVIDSNVAGNGVDGYSGGGVYGPATLVRCQITRNAAHHYVSGGPADEIGTGVDGALALISCTVADNRIVGGPVQNEPSGGVRSVPTIVDSILWNNEGNDVSMSTVAIVHHTTVGDGYAGPGNQVLDPRFRNADAGDYFLDPASPAIDAGDPTSPLDPDGTRADMGAVFFPQYPADAVERNGGGLNPSCFGSILRPVLGSTWVAGVDATAHGFDASFVLLLGMLEPLDPTALPYGELLVDVSSPVIFTSLAPVRAGFAVHQLDVPANYALGGFEIASQAIVLGDAVGFCNALDLRLGL